MRWLTLFCLACSPTTPAIISAAQQTLVTCGDGFVDPGETCDDGTNDGRYGGCAADCLSQGPYCGDGKLDGPEQCDDGVNDGAYGSCVHDCTASMGRCGDGFRNGPEVCDDGINDGGYNSCSSDCLAKGPTCGDGTLNGPEVCDDGVNDGSCGSCASDCADFGTGWFLTTLYVDSIPDAYGWPGDYWPDVFVEVLDGTGQVIWASDVIYNEDPPLTFRLPELEVGDESLTVHVWDDDGGVFLDADDLGQVTFDTRNLTGTEAEGDLQVRFTVEVLTCVP